VAMRKCKCEGMRELGVCKEEGGGCPSRALIGLRGEGERHPDGHGHQWPSALIGNQRIEGIKGVTGGIDGGRVRPASLRLDGGV
jgi:hypothetical protein